MSVIHILVILQIVLSILLWSSSFLTTLHALLTAAIGLYFSFKDKTSHRALISIFYILGSELLWRGLKASIFWEYGKYSSILIMLILIYRFGLSKLKRKIGFLIIILLLPSFASLSEFNRQAIAHAISGPICLGLAIVIFSNHIISLPQFKDYCISILMPIVSLLSIVLYSTIQFGAIDIDAAYIYEATTAGIGPNQTSNILGLGILMCFLLYIVDNRNKYTYLILGLVILFQTIVTHSRGGFWNALIAIGFAISLIVITRPHRIKFLIGLSIFSGALYFYVFPKIDEISGGSILSRYMDTDLSRREILITTELNAYRENPIFGIGPGESRKYRINYYENRKHTHTEYSRLLAEHGLFGISIILILLNLIYKIFRSNRGLSKGIAISLAIWSLLFMTHSATRLAAPCLIFALSTSHFDFSNKGKNKLKY